jgi:hypothetical protein
MPRHLELASVPAVAPDQRLSLLSKVHIAKHQFGPLAEICLWRIPSDIAAKQRASSFVVRTVYMTSSTWSILNHNFMKVIEMKWPGGLRLTHKSLSIRRVSRL